MPVKRNKEGWRIKKFSGKTYVRVGAHRRKNDAKKQQKYLKTGPHGHVNSVRITKDRSGVRKFNRGYNVWIPTTYVAGAGD